MEEGRIRIVDIEPDNKRHEDVTNERHKVHVSRRWCYVASWELCLASGNNYLDIHLVSRSF